MAKSINLLEVSEEIVSDNGSNSESENTTKCKVTSKENCKIFVSGLLDGSKEEDLKELFSNFGDVIEIVIDGTNATVKFQSNKSVTTLESQGEIDFHGTKLRIARVLQEFPGPLVDDLLVNEDSNGTNVNAVVSRSQQRPTQYLGSSCPPPRSVSYSYPVWFQPMYPPPQQVDIPHHQNNVINGTNESHVECAKEVLPVSSFNQVNNDLIFKFDSSLKTGDDGSNSKGNIQMDYRSSNGACHVCSAPSVRGVNPLSVSHKPSQDFFFSSNSGHQLQPLTPITPSYSGTEYLLPPTPTPAHLPPMTPTYYMSPSPNTYYPNSYYEYPPSSTGLAYTNIKSYSDAGGVKTSEKENVKVPAGYFASPFKRFSKFHGTPTPSQFPLRSSNVGQKYVDEDASNWYQQGDRWGQRTKRAGKQYYNPGQDQV